MIQNVVWIGIITTSLAGVDIISSSHQQNDDIFTYTKLSRVDAKNDANASLLTFEGTIQKKWDEHTLRAQTYGNFLSMNGVIVKNRLSSELNYDNQCRNGYLLNYMFGYKQENFSRLHQKFYTGPSIGVKMIDQEVHKLELRGNILFDKDKYDEQQADHYFSSRLGAIYTWKAKDNLKFIQEESYKVRLNEAENYIFYSKSMIESKISPKLLMGVNYKVDRINSPAFVSPYTGQTLSATLIVKY